MVDDPQVQPKKPVLNIGQDVSGKLEKKLGKMSSDRDETNAQAKAAQHNLEYIDLRRFPIPPEAISLIPEEKSKELQVVSFYRDADSFRVATTNPENKAVEELIYQLKERYKTEAKLYVISPASFKNAFVLYKAVPKIKEISHDVKIEPETIAKFKEEVASLDALQKKIKEVNVTDFVALVLASAVNQKASDVHIEAEKEGITVRLRIDGVLQDAAEVEIEKWHRIISRVKLLSGLKINIDTKPQDGRFAIIIDGAEVDVRVSTIPSAFGESVVMRLLRPLGDDINIEGLGLAGKALKDLQEMVSRPNGMIVTTGPTGSGKTTTLYTILRHLNKPDVKIITLEDPIEYKLEGIVQSQMDPGKDYSFGKGLKSILRQDPDVVMVGEIRDLETAEIAIQAALTGHLLLSTIHTNSAPGAVPRFLSMGVKPFLLSPALNLIMGQRLIRRLCEKCKKPAQLDPETMKKVEEKISAISAKSEIVVELGKATWFAPGKCEACDNLGYKGRLGIFEIMTITDAIKDAMSGSDVAEHHISKIAIEDGMVPLVTDGLVKASQGITSVEEVFRVSA